MTVVAVAPTAFTAAEPSQECDAQVFADIVDTSDLVASLARSIAEAGFRRDPITLRIHRAEFRQLAILLLVLIRDLAPLEGEVTGLYRRNGRRAQ
jgi:hypothetical protein